MSIEEQVRIMEGQLSNYDDLIGKMSHMVSFFDDDPEYSKEARDIVRGNISKELAKM